MNLSTHFTLFEMTNSQTAVRRGIDNTPSPAQLANLRRVAATLEQVRDLVGKPVTVSSGFRSPSLNSAIGGARNSAHLLGLAADINVSGINPRALAVMIRDSDIAFDQLIYEGTWVHIGLSESAPRRQVLTARFAGGGTTYVTGIT